MTNTATLLRDLVSTNDGTFGLMSCKGKTWKSLERSRIGDHPCIPAGVYECYMRYSPDHKSYDYGFGSGMVYGLKNVKNRSDIEIHSANWSFQLLGCIALGYSIGMIETPDKKMVKGVTNSKDSIKEFMQILNGEVFTLTILDIV